MASITATPLSALGIVKVLIDWTPTQLSDPVHVYRVTGGTQFEIIGSPVRLSGGQAILYDTTTPFDTPVSYTAVIDTPVVGRDSFTRTVAAGSWGTDDLGNAYAIPSNTGDFSVSANEGRIRPGSTGFRFATLPQTLTNVRVEGTVYPGVVAAGAPFREGLIARYTSTTDWYTFDIQFSPDGTMQAQIRKRMFVGGTVTLTSVELGTYTAFTAVRIEGEVIGTALRMRAWTTVKPSSWTTVTADTSHPSGKPGIGASLDTGNTNTTPVPLYVDNTRVTSLVPASLSSVGTVTLTADPHGWIRDPQNPARSVRLDNCDTHTFACLNASRFVFFQGLEEEDFENASGVFGVIGSPNPLTVAQTRKGPSTAMRIVSTTLADIPALKALFSSGRDLVVSLPTRYGWGIESFGSVPVSIGDVSVSRLNKRQMAKPQRLWGLPMVQTDADETYPTGRVGSNDVPVPGATYADMKATGLTYQQLATAGSLFPGVQDSFTRTVAAGGWGTSTSGDLWVVREGLAANFSVSGNQGQVAVSQRDSPRRIVADGQEADTVGQADFTVPQVATGGSFYIAMAARAVDANNYLAFGAFIETTGVVNAAIISRYLGVQAFVGPFVNTGITHTAGTVYRIKYQMDGTTAKLKVYRLADPEPAFQVTGTAPNVAVEAGAGVHIKLDAFNSNALPVPFQVDNVLINHEERTYLDWAQGRYA